MGRYLILLILASVFGPVFACQTDEVLSKNYRVKGNASLPDGTPLYIEHLEHQANPDGSRLLVHYTEPDGNPIAEKAVHYKCNATTPSYRLVDHVSGAVEGVNWTADGVETYHGAESTQLRLPSGPSIVDAGFDHAIKIHWAELVRGKRLRFDYLFARDGMFLNLRFEKSNPPELLAGEARPDTIFFRIAPSNMFIRAIARPLFVGYGVKTKALRYYLGPSNLPSMRDQSMVIIRYTSVAPNSPKPDVGLLLAGTKSGPS